MVVLLSKLWWLLVLSRCLEPLKNWEAEYTWGGRPGWGPSSGVRVRSKKFTPFNPVTWVGLGWSFENLRKMCASEKLRKMCAFEGFPPGIFWRPGTWSKSGGGRWSRKGFPRDMIRSCLWSWRIPQDISLLPLMGCRRLCSDATLFLSGWFGRRCGIDAGNMKTDNSLAHFIG